MSDPCPSCGAPLSNDGTFCKECGYDVDLAVQDYRGEGTELPEDDLDYDAFLRREGLRSGEAGAGAPWGKLLLILLAVCAILLFMIKAAGR